MARDSSGACSFAADSSVDWTALLPDDLLLAILDKTWYRTCIPRVLTDYPRWGGGAWFFQAVPLVCRRWRQLSTDPQLLRECCHTLEDCEGQPPADPLHRLRSLCGWLARRAAGSVQKLFLELQSEFPLAWQGEQEWHELLCAAAAACGGGLRELSLSVEAAWGLHMAGWAATLLRLERLELFCTGAEPEAVQLPGSLRHLTALQSACLMSDVELAVPQLPPSLTCLSLIGGARMPEQAHLTALKEVLIERPTPEGFDFDFLASLPALQTLELSSSDRLPDCLPSLKGLRALRLDGLGTGSLGDALASLTGLTQLSLSSLGMPFLPQLTGLIALRSFQHINVDDDVQEPLPAGPWAAGLESMGLCGRVAAASLDALAAARMLRDLDLYMFQCRHIPVEALSKLLRFWERHTTLERLCIRDPFVLDKQRSEALRRALRAAARARPALRIECKWLDT